MAGKPAPLLASPPASPTPAAHSSRPPLVAFGSLKGGVGKTTLSLCAAELLRERYPVVLLDADMAGTELSWVWSEYLITETSLVDLLVAPPADTDGLNGIVQQAKDRVEEAKTQRNVTRGILIPTFSRDAEPKPETLAWKRTLELSEDSMAFRLVEVIDRLRREGFAVVVDLPAFEVGFAHQVHLAIEHKSQKGTFFLVTDGDVRSLFAVWAHLSGQLGRSSDDLWKHVCVNRVGDDRDGARMWRGQEFFNQLRWMRQNVPAIKSLLLPEILLEQQSGPARGEEHGKRISPIVIQAAADLTRATFPNTPPDGLGEQIRTTINRLIPEEKERLCARGEGQ